MVPSTRVWGIRSFIRLSVRRKVDFPHPDGPINAVISLDRMEMLISLRAFDDP